MFLAFGANASELKLAVKYHHQEHELSCEAAALKMVLDFYGLQMSESEILKKIPVDKTPYKKGIWGDPDLAFVGDVDAKGPFTGYGIHWRGLKSVTDQWKKTDVLEGANVKDLTAHLEKGRPIIIWGYQSVLEYLKWKTKTGREVTAIRNEHTRVVFGFHGRRESPDGFYVMDPEEGARLWPLKEFLENWNSFGRSGIVLYR
jgi:uncharacterized protein YvpB